MAKLAIITGATKGIGAAVAERFLSADYDVINLSRSTNPSVENIRCNLTDQSALTQTLAVLSGKVAAADQVALVHNAASLIKDSAKELSADAMSELMQLNVVAPASINAALIPHMAGGSSIVFVGSTLSRKAVANSLSYVTSKHALLGLMRGTCQDLSGTAIHTAMVMPGFTDTEMLRSHVGHDETILSALAQGVLMGRLARPDEIAEVIFQASQNSVLNGAEIDANLGQIEH